MISYWQQPERRELLRLALLTTPLMGIFRVMPVALFNQDTIAEIIRLQPDNHFLPLLILALLCLNFFLQWVFNIWLFTGDSDTTVPTEMLKKRKYYLWSFLFATSQALLPMLRDFIVSSDLPNLMPTKAYFLYPIFGAYANNAVILLIIHLSLTRKNENRLALKNMQLEVSNLLAQQAQLKHQLQPHFLFNALYTLQLLIGRQPQRAQRYLQRLSTFLRRSLQYSEQNTIPTREELNFCQDYLELQKVRFPDALNYHIDISEECLEHTQLPIYTLQLLAENAVKHNAFSTQTPLHLSFKSTDDLYILVENNIIPKASTTETSAGIGLKNLAERFQLLGVATPVVHNNTAKGSFQVYVPTLAS